MSNFLDDLVEYAVAEGLAGGSTGFTLYASDLPPAPDNAVAIFESTSVAPETTMAIDYRNFTVLIRGVVDSYVTTQAQAQAIYNGLHCAPIGLLWVFCYAFSAVTPLGKDDNGRPIFSINFRSMRTSDVS